MPARLTHNGVKFGMVAAALLPDNVVITTDNTGKAALAGVGAVGCGFTWEGAASGADVLVYEKRGEAPILAAAMWTAGDLLKCAANGELTPETDPAVPTVYTVAQAAETAATAHKAYLVRWI